MQRVEHTLLEPGRRFKFPGMRSSGQITNVWLQTAAGLTTKTEVPDSRVIYNDFFAAISTASDLYAFDNDLFGGKLIPPAGMKAVFAPRAPWSGLSVT